MNPRRTPEEMQELVDSVESLALAKMISKADACRELGIKTSLYYNTKQKCPKTKSSRKSTSIVMQKIPIAQGVPRFDIFVEASEVAKLLFEELEKRLEELGRREADE